MYIFGRQSVFQNCYELIPAMSHFSTKPNKLQIVTNDSFPTTREKGKILSKQTVCPVEDVTALGVLVYQMAESGATGKGIK